MSINKKSALDLVMALMAVPGASGQEAAIADVVSATLLHGGVPQDAIFHDTANRRTPSPGQVGNLIVKLPGTVRKPRMMLSAHLDTVPICLGCQPSLRGNRIVSADKTTGLGADDRAGVAAILVAVLDVLEGGADYPPLTLCFFVQEEIGLQGSRQLVVSRLGKPRMAFNFDGGDPFKLTVGATGGERMRIILRGIPAHAGLAPEQGASAITAAGLAIASLHKQGWLGKVKKRGRLGTSNIGVIRGGAATNVVADQLELQAEARSHDQVFRQTIADTIEQAFHQAAAEVKNHQAVTVTAQVDRRVDYESFRLGDESPPVNLAREAIEQLGGQALTAITDGGVDANWLNHHGIPTVTLGCGQRNVHTRQETLDVPAFLNACRIARSLIANACR